MKFNLHKQMWTNKGIKYIHQKTDWQVTNDNDQKDVKISKDRDLFTYNFTYDYNNS